MSLLLGLACGGMHDSKNLEKSRTRLDLAKDYLHKGQLDAAESEANKALAYHSSNEEAHHLLGLMDLMRGSGAQRISNIESCLTGLDAEVQQAEQERHLLAADAHFARAVELAPDFGEAWASRGTVAMLLETPDQAIDHLARALEIPASLDNVAVVRANFGWAYFLRQEHVLATKELLQALQIQPGLCIATYRLGRVYFARKEWEKALQKLQEVVGQPECPIQDAHLYLMKTQIELGATEGLSEAGRACVALAPNSCIAMQCRDLASFGPDAGAPAGSNEPLPNAVPPNSNHVQ